MYCVFDTETSGLPISTRYKEYPSPFNLSAYEPCRLVQLSYQIYDSSHKLVLERDMIIAPDKFIISPESTKFHGITHEDALSRGKPIIECLVAFAKDVMDMECILVGHNVLFDINVVTSELYRHEMEDISKKIVSMPRICTMESNKHILKKEMTLKSGKKIIKDPSLKEVYEFYCKKPIENQHNSLYDVRNTATVFFLYLEHQKY